MKKFIYKYSFGALLLLSGLSGLSSCCANSYGSTLAKNTAEIKEESVTLREKPDAGCKKKSSCYLRKFFSRKKPKEKTEPVLPNFKSYADPMTDSERKDLSFIVSAAADKSSIALAMAQGEIKGALSRIREIHPLALLQALAEDPALIAGMKKMQGRDWVWNIFITELSKVFSQAASLGAFSVADVAAFASTLGLDSGTVTSIVDGERWAELIDVVIQNPAI
ncbi:hypothetical protein [Chlamydia trachomatis]|uniref:hypothetical protein n=1 Tax=Chlamydia trachomatis TaxID=813 RepID=UPI000C1F8881|nr:hypothetical protein [Chlamydia trachomatis]ATW15904.1 hypothetical protein BKB89_04010 [Chlamydia trachomatis]ATW16810.1 hypothetical protein BKB90_04005 [Chlamydia trachomatis]ATW17725.1 hypothetical protein BKB91_04010 [Chlamydia trachomatis]